MLQRVVTSSDCRRPKGTELPKPRFFSGGCSIVKGMKGQHGVELAIKEIVKKPGEDGITIECISARILKDEFRLNQISLRSW